METLRTVMLNILAIVFLTTLLDMLLPEGSLRSYVKMTMGFFVVLTLLQPVVRLAAPDQMLAQWQLIAPALQQTESLAVQGTAYEEQLRQLDRLYSEKLNEQVRGLLLLTNDLEAVQVTCTVQEQCLQQITVWIPADAAADQARIVQALSGYYGLAAEQIMVKPEEAEGHGLEKSE